MVNLGSKGLINICVVTRRANITQYEHRQSVIKLPATFYVQLLTLIPLQTFYYH